MLPGRLSSSRPALPRASCVAGPCRAILPVGHSGRLQPTRVRVSRGAVGGGSPLPPPPLSRAVLPGSRLLSGGLRQAPAPALAAKKGSSAGSADNEDDDDWEIRPLAFHWQALRFAAFVAAAAVAIDLATAGSAWAALSAPTGPVATLTSAARGLVARVVATASHLHFPAGHSDALVLLSSAVAAVTVISKIKGTPILGFLITGLFIGPHALGLVHNASFVAGLAEIGVMFLLFHIGLELSLDKLQKMSR